MGSGNFPKAQQPELSSLAAAAERFTVLNVEDDPAKREYWTLGLREAGLQVVEAAPGEDALQILRAAAADVVLLDAAGPDPGGLELCRKIKNTPETRNVPVVHISRHTSSKNRVHGLENGADSSLSADEPLEVVAATLRAMARLRSLRDPESDARVSLLAAIVEQSEDAIISCSPEGRIISWNRGAESLYGYAADEVLGRSPAILFVQEDELHALHEDVRNGRAVLQRETDQRRKNGALVRISISVSPIRDRAGRIVGLAAIARDISPRVAAGARIEAMVAELRRLSGQLLRMQDQERRRIARELHDGAVQDLAGLSLRLSMLQELESIRSEPEAAKAVQDCVDHANASARGVRTLSYLLHPPLLDELGLATALQTFAEGYSKRTGIAVRLALPGVLPRVDNDRELALFRIVQESLVNIHKHSGSADAEIRALLDGDSLTLEIEDHGRGIPAPALQPPTQGVVLGVGIPGMQERARQLGGSLETDSRPGRTVIRVRLPWQ